MVAKQLWAITACVRAKREDACRAFVASKQADLAELFLNLAHNGTSYYYLHTFANFLPSGAFDASMREALAEFLVSQGLRRVRESDGSDYVTWEPE